MSVRIRLPWRAHTVTVARLSISNYLRSGWIYLELALVLGAVSLSPAATDRPGAGGGLPAFFGISGYLFLVEALMGSLLLGRRSFGPSAYMFLARLPSRKPYAAGIALAAAVLRIPLFLLMLGLGFAFAKIVHPPVQLLVFGGLDMLLPACLIASLAVLLSPPVGNKLSVLIFLGWVLVIFRPVGSTAALPHALNSALDALLVPLRPVADAMYASTQGTASNSSLAPILVQTAYLVLVAVLAGWSLERRTLDIH